MSRRAYTVLEVVLALAVMSVMILGGVWSLNTFARPAQQGEVSLDQLNRFQVATERVDHDMREARSVIYPTPQAGASRLIIVRDFDGRQLVYYYSTALRQLRRAWLDPGGLAREDTRPVMEDLDRVFFQVSANGLISWGLFSTEMFVLGAVGRENR